MKNLIRFGLITLFSITSFNAFAAKDDVQGLITCSDKDGGVIQVKATSTEYIILLANGKAPATEYIILLGSQNVVLKSCMFTPLK